MKKNVFLSEGLARKLMFYAILLLVIALPWHRVATSIPMIILSVVTLGTWFTNPSLFSFSTRFQDVFYYALFIGFALLHVLWVPANSFPDFLHRELSFLPLYAALPLVFYTYLPTSGKNPHQFFIPFVWSCVAFGLFSVVDSYIRRYHQVGIDAIFYESLFKTTYVNPGFASLLMNVSLFYVLFMAKDKMKGLGKGISACILLFIIVLASSRMALLSTLFILLLWLGKQVLRSKGLYRKAALVVLVLIGIGTTSQIPYVKHRFTSGYRVLTQANEETLPDKRFARFVVWEQAFKLIKERPLLGQGTGDVIPVLRQQYQRIGFKWGDWKRYNAHNQVLESWIEFGVFGFLISLSLLIYPIYLLWIRKKWRLAAMVMILFFLFAMVESVFETQGGLVSFILFSSILYFLPKRDT